MDFDVVLNLRYWRDFNFWIGEEYPSLDTRKYEPREWVAPIHYDTSRDAAVRYKGMVVYHKATHYRGGV